jgi:hypothetical protein
MLSPMNATAIKSAPTTVILKVLPPMEQWRRSLSADNETP